MEDAQPGSSNVNTGENPIQIFDKHAQAYECRFMDVGNYSPSLDLICKQLKPDAKVLDLGCGPGNMAKYLLGKFPKLKLLGIDGSHAMINLARRNNPQAEFYVEDIRNLTDFTISFDLIILSFCLPYLNPLETEHLLKKCATWINSTGIIFISTMEAENSQSTLVTNSYNEKTLQQYYSFSDLQKLLRKNHFSIKNLQRIPIIQAHTPAQFDLCLVAHKRAD